MAGGGRGLLHIPILTGGDQVCADPFMHSFVLSNSSSRVAFQPEVIVVCPRLLFVVGIEQMVVALIQRAITRQKGLQHEGLEEPGDMRQMPLRRADIRHALDHIVLGLQRLTESLAGSAHPLITLP